MLSDRLAGDATVRNLASLIDDSVWWADALLVVDGREELTEVGEIRETLVAWQSGLPGSMSTQSARAAAHEQTIAWSARLTWVAALLEATR